MESVLNKLWDDYCQISPASKKIHDLLSIKNPKIKNDHIALRGFQLEGFGIKALSKVFLDNGYTEGLEYHFKQKKLYAKHYEPPNKNWPKIFISELLISEFSAGLQNTIETLTASVDLSAIHPSEFCVSGRLWDLDFETYKRLYNESEYAGWMSAFGYRANHFTISVNSLDSHDDLEQLNEFIKSKGYVFNSSGGEIKGSKEVGLRQSSTMAEKVNVKFIDGSESLPSCYYEFATRYPVNGALYDGFVTASADKIFESTDNK